MAFLSTVSKYQSLGPKAYDINIIKLNDWCGSRPLEFEQCTVVMLVFMIVRFLFALLLERCLPAAGGHSPVRNPTGQFALGIPHCVC